MAKIILESAFGSREKWFCFFWVSLSFYNLKNALLTNLSKSWLRLLSEFVVLFKIK